MFLICLICSDENQYTFVSSRGKSVIDYIITEHCTLPDIIEFKIHQCTDIIDQFNLRNFISSTCKVPDHAILSVSLSLFKDYQMRTSVKTYVENTPTKKRRIYDFNSVSLQ